MENSILNQSQNYHIKFETTKAIHMSYSLQKLVEDFSIEQNTTQRQIFENALIEYVNKYRYKDIDNSNVYQLPNNDIATVKTIHMSHSHQRLLKNYSFKYNMTQRQVLENALIEYLSQYELNATTIR